MLKLQNTKNGTKDVVEDKWQRMRYPASDKARMCAPLVDNHEGTRKRGGGMRWQRH